MLAAQIGSFLTGKLLSKFGFRAAFMMHAMFSLPTLLILLRFNPKKENKPKEPPKFRELYHLVTNDLDVMVSLFCLREGTQTHCSSCSNVALHMPDVRRLRFSRFYLPFPYFFCLFFLSFFLLSFPFTSSSSFSFLLILRVAAASFCSLL